MIRDRSYRLLLFIAIATHLPLLFNDGIYWDSWMPEYASERGDLYLTVQPFHQTGVPLVGYLYYAIGRLPASVFIYKLIAFASTCAIGMLVYAIAARARFFSTLECRLLGITAIGWAAFRVYAVDAIAPYMLATALVFVAFHLCIRGPLTWKLRVLAAIIVALAILLYSPLYIFVYGMVATWFVIDRPHASAWRWLVARADFVLLPVVLFVATHALFPPAPRMTDNYSVKLNAALFATHAKNFLIGGVWAPIRDSLNVPTFALFVVLAGGFAFFARRRLPRWRQSLATAPARSWRDIAACSAVAAALFGFGSLAFILVGKSPDGTFWWTRQAMLISWAVGVGLIALTWIVQRLNRALLVVWLALVAWIAVGSWVQHQHTYLMLQARWISYRSIAHNLQRSHAFDDVTFLHIDEQELVAAGYQEHTAYTWGVMLSYFAWSHEDKAVVDRLPFQFYCDEKTSDPLEWRRFALANVDLAGRHARLVIHHGPAAPYGHRNPYLVELELVASYYARRFFRPSDIPNFLDRVTTLERAPLDPVPSCATTVTP
ncbi:MAG TPA: hypothetical protein VIV40_17375 [Kofleriaceae bacterium]